MRKHVEVIKNDVAIGAAILMPALAALYLIITFVGIIDDMIKSVVESTGYWISFPGQGILILLVVFFLAGVFLKGVLGKIMTGINDIVFGQIPGIGIIYKSLKKILESMASSKDSGYLGVVMVDFPSSKYRSIALITSKGIGEIKDHRGNNMFSLYVPTSPIPSSGFTIYASEEDLEYVDITIEEAMSLVISAGVAK